jgi:hypothetical protein
MNLSYYRLSIDFTRFIHEIRTCLNRGILDRSWHRLNVQFLNRWWKSGNRGKQTSESRITRGLFSNWSSTRNKLIRQQVHKTLIHVLWPIMITRLSYLLKFTQLRQVNHCHRPSIGNLWDFSDISNVVPTEIGSLFHYGRCGFVLPSVYQFRY